MPGFDGLEDAQKVLKKVLKERERVREKEKKKYELEMTKRVVVGRATEEDLAYIEEWYQGIRRGVSPAYFSGSMFYVGDSWTEWYKSLNVGGVGLGEALVYGAVMKAVYKL